VLCAAASLCICSFVRLSNARLRGLPVPPLQELMNRRQLHPIIASRIVGPSLTHTLPFQTPPAVKEGGLRVVGMPMTSSSMIRMAAGPPAPPALGFFFFTFTLLPSAVDKQ